MDKMKEVFEDWKFQIYRGRGAGEIRKHFDTEETEIVFGERLREISAPFRVIIKTTKPWAQARNRIFNGNSRSVRTAPLKILTPVLRVLSFTKLRSKSLKFPAAAIRKAHPIVRIPPFSVLFQSALPLIISNSTNKNKDRTISTTANYSSDFRFWNRKMHLLSNSSAEYSLVSADKVLASFLLVWIWNCERESAAGECGYGNGEP